MDRLPLDRIADVLDPPPVPFDPAHEPKPLVRASVVLRAIPAALPSFREVPATFCPEGIAHRPGVGLRAVVQVACICGHGVTLEIDGFEVCDGCDRAFIWTGRRVLAARSSDA